MAIITNLDVMLAKRKMSLSELSKKVGTTWIRIIQRIMGLILMVMAVQFIINGVDPIIKDWLK